MIAHVQLASHPHPKNVFVIGGGGGGVVREVLKRETVQQVVLCDIDELEVRSEVGFGRMSLRPFLAKL